MTNELISLADKLLAQYGYSPSDYSLEDKERVIADEIIAHALGITLLAPEDSLIVN
jgi:hypothetical protein